MRDIGHNIDVFYFSSLKEFKFVMYVVSQYQVLSCIQVFTESTVFTKDDIQFFSFFFLRESVSNSCLFFS